MITEIDRGHERFHECMSALTAGIGMLSPLPADVFDSVKGFTLIEMNTAILRSRSALKLLRAQRPIEEQMLGQYCSYQEGKHPRLGNFLTDGGRRITVFEQTHLFEHLLKRYLPRISHTKAPIESRTFATKPDHKTVVPVILISNQFEPAVFRDLCQYIWHLLGRAIRLGTYPTVEQLEASLSLRRKTLSDNDFARKILDRAETHVT